MYISIWGKHELVSPSLITNNPEDLKERKIRLEQSFPNIHFYIEQDMNAFKED